MPFVSFGTILARRAGLVRSNVLPAGFPAFDSLHLADMEGPTTGCRNPVSSGTTSASDLKAWRASVRANLTFRRDSTELQGVMRPHADDRSVDGRAVAH